MVNSRIGYSCSVYIGYIRDVGRVLLMPFHKEISPFLGLLHLSNKRSLFYNPKFCKAK